MKYYVNPYDTAFARPYSEPYSGCSEQAQMGMSTIAYFTAAAMQGLAANPGLNDCSIEDISEMAVELAHKTIQSINTFMPSIP